MSFFAGNSLELKSSKRRWQKLCLSFMFIAACIFAISCALYAFSNMMSFFKTPSQLVRSDYISAQQLRIGGYVKRHSFTPNKSCFTLTDGNKAVLVFYRGALPALFREGQGVTVQGHFIALPHGVYAFQATQILAKHDETYRAAK